MIVKRVWVTMRLEKSIKGYGEDMVTRRWVGFFLFGFIPLWIENLVTEYK